MWNDIFNESKVVREWNNRIFGLEKYNEVFDFRSGILVVWMRVVEVK